MWLCCFCGKEIREEPPDPCTLTVAAVEGKPQWWSCHAECFKAKLAAEPPIFAPVLF